MGSSLKKDYVAGRLALDHAQDVFLAHDEVFLAIDLDLGARVLAEEDLVADLDVERDEFAVVVDLTLAGGDKILFGKYSGTEIKIDGEEHLIMREEDILGVVEG